MAYGKWIGAFLGALNGGIIGALAGYAIGRLFDSIVEGQQSDRFISSSNSDGSYGYSSVQTEQEGARNGFLFSLLVLSAHVIQADGKIMHSEMNYLRGFLRQNFGEAAVSQGEGIVNNLFEYRKTNGDSLWNAQIRDACTQMRGVMPEEHLLQLVAYLCEIAKADGHVDTTEVDAIRSVCSLLGISPAVADQYLSLGGSSVEDAYKVLGVSPSATDEEIRKAYRELVRKNHPDRVATLGEDVRETAKKKMQEINDAKARIDKARG